MKRSKFFILSLILLVTAGTIAAQDLSVEYLENISAADSLIKKSKWGEAEEKFMEAMRLHPSNPTNVLLMSNVGMLRHYAGRDSSALAILNDAVSIAPRSVTVRSNRAEVLMSLGQINKALDDYTAMLEQDSMLIEPHHMRCLINLSGGNLTAAEKDAQFLEKNFPNEVETNEACGIINVIKGNFKAAVANYTVLVKKRPTATNYGERAYCYIMTDYLNEASADLNEAIRLDPQNGELYLYRAILNKKRFRPSDSADDIRKAISLGVDRRQIEQWGLL